MSLSTLEAYDLVRFAEVFDARLATVDELLSSRPGLEREKEWMATALQLVRTEREPAPALLERVRDLPELEEVREEFAFTQQNVWVDALEKLHAGITFCSGSRAPVIEALFPHLKFPQLRRASREAVHEFVAGYERRLKSAYVSRIFGRPDFAMVRPVIEQVAATHAAWLACFVPVQLAPEQAAPLRQELIALGRRLDATLRQARCLAEAALVPFPESFENSGLAARPKKRAPRPLLPGEEAVETVVAPLEDFLAQPQEPGLEPTPEELADLAADASATPEPAPAPEPASPVEPAQPVEATAPVEPSPPVEAEPAVEAPKPGKRGRKKAEPKTSLESA